MLLPLLVRVLLIHPLIIKSFSVSPFSLFSQLVSNTTLLPDTLLILCHFLQNEAIHLLACIFQGLIRAGMEEGKEGVLRF